jgi:hypothetical protein
MCFLLSIILPFQSAEAHAPAIIYTPDQFWDDYEKNKSVTNVVDHVQKLSTRMDTDTPEQLEFKKSAVLWFLATGGKYGFRSAPATSAEKDIMINALIFGTMLHRVSHADELLHLIDICGEVEIEAEVSAHLIEAQRIITATQIMLVSSSLNIKKRIQELFNNEYIATITPPTVFTSIEWQQEVEKFSKIFTAELDKRAKRIIRNLKLRFHTPEAYFGFKKPTAEATAVKFSELVLKNCTQYSESKVFTPFYSEAAHDSDDSDSDDDDHRKSCKFTQEGLKKMDFCLPCDALDALHVLDFIEDAKSDSEIEALDTMIYLLS